MNIVTIVRGTSIVYLVHLTKKVSLAGDKQKGDFIINNIIRAGRIYSSKKKGLTISRDNNSALLIAIAIVALSVIVGFTIYFNNPSLSQAWSVQQQQQQKD